MDFLLCCLCASVVKLNFLWLRRKFLIFVKFCPDFAHGHRNWDQSGAWPEDDLHVLAKLGAMRWAIPWNWAARDSSGIELHFRLRGDRLGIAGDSFWCSRQRDSAVDFIDCGWTTPRCGAICCRNWPTTNSFQPSASRKLTTSRQGGKPACWPPRTVTR